MNETRKLKGTERVISSDPAYKGTVVNRALPSLQGDSLEIMLTVPLNIIFYFLTCLIFVHIKKKMIGLQILGFKSVNVT